jgi:hypothetical protein
VVASTQIKANKEVANVNQIIKTSRKDEYAIAVMNSIGLRFLTISQNEEKVFTITESEEVCLEGKSV